MVFRNYQYFVYHFNRNLSIWIFDVQSNVLFLEVIFKKKVCSKCKPQLLVENLKIPCFYLHIKTNRGLTEINHANWSAVTEI